MAEQQYQSLYRRYRPQRFSEVRGQDHVTRALQNAVRESRVTHGYLFSGPRGTGKTSTARILAKALNCLKLDDGEPCGMCDSCQQVQAGTSFDVHELDAASNNGVDAMRELVSRAALGTPGRWKVYIVDEVHMLSVPASNTLLKTLEEPPGHVVFVLATTDPQKVLPTLRSRVQHVEVRLLPSDVLSGLVRDISADAGLDVAEGDLDKVVRKGSGSARDALSVLDQVAALGEATDDVAVADEVVEAICDRDTGRALVAVAEGCAAGHDPRRLAEDLLEHLRCSFLSTMAPKLADLPEEAAKRADDQARRLGPAALVRAMETVGEALAEMREALDPRVTLEVALVRLTKPEADSSPAALLERIERLERRVDGGESVPAAPTAAAAVPRPAPAPPPASPAPTPPAKPPSNPTRRGALGAFRNQQTASAAAAQPPPAPAPEPVVEVVEPVAEPEALAGELPSRDDLTMAWGDSVLTGLRPRVKALFSAGRFLSVGDGKARFALPNVAHKEQAESHRETVESALAAHYGRPVPLDLVVEEAATPAAPVTADEEISVHDLEDAPAGTGSPVDMVKQAFGAEEVDDK